MVINVGQYNTFPERQVQLTELMVKPENQIQVNMRWNPATAAVEDVDDTMLDERLRDMKELIWKRYGSKWDFDDRASRSGRWKTDEKYEHSLELRQIEARRWCSRTKS